MIRWLAEKALRASLPDDERDAALGDLDEQHARTRAEGSGWRADLEFAHQAATLIFYAWLDRARRTPRPSEIWRWSIPDLRDSARALARSPGFTILAVLSLAIGVGGTSTMAGLMYDVLWRPLPVAHPERLFSLDRIGPQGRDDSFTYAEAAALRSAAGHAAFTVTRDEDHVVVTAGGTSTYVVADLVDGAFFETLGIKARFGRMIDESDAHNAARVAVVSEQFWRIQMASAADAIGTSIQVRGVPFTVVGIAPAAFRGHAYPGWFSLALPITTAPLLGWRDFVAERSPALAILGRLSSAPTSGEARAVAAAFQRCCAVPNERLSLVDMSHGLGGSKNDFRPDVRTLLIALGGGGVLLLILSCANVAVLLITRASLRAREISLRMSLGASRARVMCRELIESALLAAMGGGAGYAVAVALRRALPALLPRNLAEMARVMQFEADGSSIAIATAVAAASVLLVGLLPAIEASRVDIVGAIKAGGRGTTFARAHRFERAGVTLQIAIALLLTTAGAQLAMTLWKLSHVATGLTTAPLYLAPIETRGTSLERDGIVPSHARILEAVRAIPGVDRAGMASFAPFVGGRLTTRSVELPGSDVPSFKSILVAATPDYFETVGIRMAAGRSFTAADANNPSAVIITESLARALGSDARVAGRSMKIGTPGQMATIIGVAADTRMRTLRTEAPLIVYAPAGASGAWPFLELAITSSLERTELERNVRAAVARAEPGAHLQFVTTLDTEVAASLVQERFAGVAAIAFAAISLCIAALGLYGVIAQQVGRRTSEFGLRAALGAQRADIRRLVTRSVLSMVWTGAAMGVVLAIAAGYALSSRLYGVRPFEARLLVAALAVLGLSVAVAAAIPARRASHADPLAVLRDQ